MSWQDARFGTLANVILVIALVLAWSQASFAGMTRHELQTLMPATLPAQRIVTQADFADLPAPVRNWLTHSGIVGKPLIHTVHLQQQGEMRTSPGGAWMPVTAEQYFTVDQPGFSWLARVRMLPGITLLGRDLYTQGKGHMLIKVLGLLPVADSKGPTIDQGTMLRYLAETVWFPSAALSEWLEWKAINKSSALATMNYGGVSAAAIFHFTPQGDIASFETMRYYDRKPAATLEKWLIQPDPQGFRDFAGIRMPARTSVTWQLKEGDFTWFRVEISDVVYNQVL